MFACAKMYFVVGSRVPIAGVVKCSRWRQAAFHLSMSFRSQFVATLRTFIVPKCANIHFCRLAFVTVL